jgi:GTP cyclohydrolase I
MCEISNLEITNSGNANGISLQLQEIIKNEGKERSLTKEEKQFIIEDATEAYGQFLDALGVDWRNDPNSSDTPRRVAKAYVNDLWRGRYETLGEITSFPSDGYNGIVMERDIPIISMCSHHHQTIQGRCHIAYVPGPETKVIGLSKLNRVVEHFSRRGAIQEQLTMAIHNAMDQLIEGNEGIMVMMHATHNCVSCRGIKHMGASMVTSEVSGVFADHQKTAKQEVLELLKLNLQAYS